MLTGKDVHNAFTQGFQYVTEPWEELPEISKDGYQRVANALNIMMDDDVTIDAIKCPACGDMLEDLRNHPCLVSR